MTADGAVGRKRTSLYEASEAALIPRKDRATQQEPRAIGLELVAQIKVSLLIEMVLN